MLRKSDNSKYVQAYRGLRGPAWRLALAAELPPNRMHRLVCEADPDVRDVHHFQQLCSRGDSGKSRAKAHYPAIAAAYGLNQDEAKCAAAKILTLGASQRGEIAARLDIEEDILEKWEGLVFDVRQGRDAVGWIHAQVIRPEQSRGNGQLASKMKAAVAGGPVVAQAILDLDSRMPVTAGEKLFDRKLTLHLKFDEAAELSLSTNREKMFFMKLYVELQSQENRLKLAERKLERRCAEARDKLELAKIRMEAVQQRKAARAAAHARCRRERELKKAKKQAQREYLAAQQRAQLRSEQKGAVARAAASPLSGLIWGSKVGSVPLTSMDDEMAKQARSESVPEETMPIGEEAARAAVGHWLDLHLRLTTGFSRRITCRFVASVRR